MASGAGGIGGGGDGSGGIFPTRLCLQRPVAPYQHGRSRQQVGDPEPLVGLAGRELGRRELAVRGPSARLGLSRKMLTYFNKKSLIKLLSDVKVGSSSVLNLFHNKSIASKRA